MQTTKTICKTIRQYSKSRIPEEKMTLLQEIAEDYATVKNHVYQQYGGIGGLSKLYPGYTIQNEMTKSGLRQQLEMPSVYFYLAIFDALGDIKAQWSHVKTGVSKAVKSNENFTEGDKHYLRFVLKVNNCFQSILTGEELCLHEKLIKQYEIAAEHVDRKRLDNYLRRQVRKHLKKMRTDTSDIFAISAKAYRYGDHGIYIAGKKPRQRIFIPLTDANQYERQLKIRLYPEEGRVEISAPVDVRVKRHEDYQNKVGVAFGMFTMLTTDAGHTYGTSLGEFVREDADWMQAQTRNYRKNKADNPGRKKYQRQKQKRDARLHSYINAELNRFFSTEKPEIIYIPKLLGHSKAGKIKKYNIYTSAWQRGYIKKRLMQKCAEHSVELVEVFAKDISNLCSRCGAVGSKEKGMFRCEACGYEAESKVNTACNAMKRGEKTVQEGNQHE